MFKRTVSIFLAVIICISAFIVPGTAKSDTKESISISEQLKHNGMPIITTELFVKLVKTIFFPRINVTIDDTLKNLTDYVAERCGLDVGIIVENVPDVQDLTRLLYRTFSLDSTKIRETIYEYSDQLFSEGKRTESYIAHFIGALFSVIDKLEFGAENRGNNVIEVVLYMTFLDGSTEKVCSGLFVNLDTGIAYGLNDSGMLGSGFNYDIYNLVGYATVHCWQRDMGFCFEYDLLCYILPIFNYKTRRFKFDYDGSEWMIQIWKGNYVVANGSEVGIYKRDPDSIGSFYYCVGDEDLLNMSMTLSHYDETLISFEKQSHWWLNGFSFGKRLYLPSTLDLSFSIEMKDEEMLKAFTESIDKEYHHDIKYSVDGLTVYCEW